MENRKSRAKILISGGMLLLAASLCVTIYNLWEGHRAADSAESLVCQIQELTMEAGSDWPLTPEMEIPVLEIEGNLYIGILEVPSLGLTLPVMSDWSYPKLKLSPCRFSGSAYLDDMIIAAHNYPMHFGRLKDLNIDDEVLFTDVDGRLFSYRVSELQTIGSMELDELQNGEWDLTLFTCTIDGKDRVTVRCERLLLTGEMEAIYEKKK